jgi:hypothetical protein
MRMLIVLKSTLYIIRLAPTQQLPMSRQTLQLIIGAYSCNPPTDTISCGLRMSTAASSTSHFDGAGVSVVIAMSA